MSYMQFGYKEAVQGTCTSSGRSMPSWKLMTKSRMSSAARMSRDAGLCVPTNYLLKDGNSATPLVSSPGMVDAAKLSPE